MFDARFQAMVVALEECCFIIAPFIIFLGLSKVLLLRKNVMPFVISPL